MAAGGGRGAFGGGGRLIAEFSARTRRAALATLDREPFDLAVIGGGITGVAVARDAALRGYRTVLFEQGDFASGTSSASSRLIHGGLRYLAQGHLGLVFEALSERRILRRLAPHLVRPLDFLFPVYEGDPNSLARLTIGVGLYDVLALLGSERFHRRLSPEAVRHIEPGLRADGLEGGLSYYDCQVDDARLTLETAIDAHELGATVLNYVRVDRRDSQGKFHRLRATDALEDSAFEIRARTVINATGPWSDRFLPEELRPLVRPTKGVHLVMAPGRLPLHQAVVMQSRGDERILFAIPWGGVSYVGTTDTPYAGPPEEVRADPADVDYLLGITAAYFPGAGLSRADVVSTWAGLRPLVRSERTAPAQIPREHEILEPEPGFLTIAGGKLTTHRRMAGQVVDRAALRLRAMGIPGDRCRTAARALPGGRNHPQNAAGEEMEIDRRAAGGDLPRELVRHLVMTYGSRSERLFAFLARSPALTARLVPDLPYVEAEVAFALEHEMVMTPGDFFMRRTTIFHKSADAGLGALDRFIEIAGAGLEARNGAASAPGASVRLEREEYQAAIARSRGPLNR